MNDLTTSANLSANIVANPFGSVTSNLTSNIGTTQASTHELAEMQAQIFLAKQFPRDQRQAAENILTACQRPGLANVAVYTYARGGTNISGPSIRLAEEIARNWGNLECGWNELEREYDKSKVRAFAWDKETNVLKTLYFYVPHYRTTKSGKYRITDERDLYELLANQAARRMRNCILALIPGDVIDAAVEQCQKTMVTHVDISPASIKKLVDAFALFGVTKAQIEKRIQRRLESITPAQFVRMREIYTSLNDGMSAPEDWFEAEVEQAEPTKKEAAPNATAATESLKASLKASPERLFEESEQTPAIDKPDPAPAASRPKRTNGKAQAAAPSQAHTPPQNVAPTSQPPQSPKPSATFRERIIAAKTRDDLTRIADEVIKCDGQLPDEERDALYRMIEDKSVELEVGK